MPSRRRKAHFDHPSLERVGAIERAAEGLQAASRVALNDLVPFNEPYSALIKMGAEIRIALNVINGRAPDHDTSTVTPGFMGNARKGEDN
ncbi:hypothetical protein ACSBOB_01425 [Mesorhizobium sp. ASY16-5R]|uniref:hypothetical protein n=1 Tax=Mesorhizobium sp. ASY16-5R TaxID=3445772 RepID=UPI003FA14935